MYINHLKRLAKLTGAKYSGKSVFDNCEFRKYNNNINAAFLAIHMYGSGFVDIAMLENDVIIYLAIKRLNLVVGIYKGDNDVAYMTSVPEHISDAVLSGCTPIYDMKPNEYLKSISEVFRSHVDKLMNITEST